MIDISSNTIALIDGQRVRLRLDGDENLYRGIVVKSRKLWVEIQEESDDDGLTWHALKNPGVLGENDAICSLEIEEIA